MWKVKSSLESLQGGCLNTFRGMDTLIYLYKKGGDISVLRMPIAYKHDLPPDPIGESRIERSPCRLLGPCQWGGKQQHTNPDSWEQVRTSMSNRGGNGGAETSRHCGTGIRTSLKVKEDSGGGSTLS